MAVLGIRRRIGLRRNDSLLTDVIAVACLFVGKAEFNLPMFWTCLDFLLDNLAYLRLLDLSFLYWVVLQSKDTLVYEALLRHFLLIIGSRRLIIGDLDLLTGHIFICSFLVILRW